VGSPRVKLLYDIYHMQIMEGDVIRTIRDNIAHIGHFHTAGNPGRNELDEAPELSYPAIARHRRHRLRRLRRPGADAERRALRRTGAGVPGVRCGLIRATSIEKLLSSLYGKRAWS
jgi:sugar phosphate isomerase/epimerase